MRTQHAVIDRREGRNHVRSGVLSIGWRHNLISSALLPLLGDANGTPLQLLGVVVIQLLLGNSHFRVPFIVTKPLMASMIIDTEFLYRYVHVI